MTVFAEVGQLLNVTILFQDVYNNQVDDIVETSLFNVSLQPQR